MRLFKTLMLMVVMLTLGVATASAREGSTSPASDGSTVYLPTSDGLCDIYVVEGTVTFKASSTGSISDNKDFGVAFKPANEGEHIQITVNSIDISGGTHLIMYDGNVDYTKIGTWGAGGADPFRYFPAGWVQEIVKGKDEGYTFVSTTDNGVVAFGCTTRGTSGMTGWDITVTSLSAKDMEYVSTSATLPLTDVNRGARNQALYQVNVVTDGGSNPLTLNALSINTSSLSAVAVSNVRLYRGSDASGELLATAATVGETLSASDVTLKAGNNRFTVVADILPDATGTLPALSVEGVTVDGTARTASAATGSITINNVVFMPAVATTFTVRDDVAFYDDGGANGNITQGFTGTVTFVPATAGDKIKVDFSKLDLFNTSSVGHNDVFKFYNGREANEDNLITTLLNEAEVVKSTADDGSMTITLTSTAGTTKSGWEAVVSEFLPGDMTFKALAVNADAEVTSTVAAGDRGAKMLIVDVQTDNQANALQLTDITLESTTANAIDGYTIYSLGSKNTFSTANVFATGTLSASPTVASGSLTLAEGHNYLAVVVDVNERLINNNEVSLSVAGATVSGTAVQPGEAVTATRRVDNTCVLTVGTHSHNIYDKWDFTHEAGYSGKYDTTTGDRIVTFTPQVEGAVAEIYFNDFNVTYSSSSYYGVRAVFEIYSGTTVNEDNLLWRLADYEHSTTGPGKTLRSTAADGSLTVRFNTKDSQTYYASTGWHAVVAPFINHEMTVDEVTVNQTSTALLPLGSEGADLIDFNVVTEGNLSTLQLQGVKLDLTGAESLSKVNVYYCGSTASREAASLLGSVTDPTEGTVTITGEQALAEGDNYFYVTVDVKSDGTPEQTVDAGLKSILLDTGEEVIDNNPEGSRLTKAMYIMQSGDNTVVVSQPLMFYDDGGPEGDFSKGFEGAVTFVPGTAGYGIEINAVEYATGSTSNYFYVYNGREHSGTTDRIGSYSGTTGPVNVVSSAEDGSLTVYFKSATYSSPVSGWAIEVKLHEYAPNALTAAVASSASDADVVRGSRDAELVKIALTVEGDNGEVELNDFAFTTAGSATAARLYYTGSAETFSTATAVGNEVSYGGDITFHAAEPLVINKKGTYYLWLAVDIADDAEPGSMVSATFTALSANVDVEAVTATRTVKAGFKGTYVIGNSAEADFATFAAATQAMAVGVEGAVRFEVEDGTYAENVVITDVAGTSSEHNIVFTSRSGNRDAVVIAGGNPDTSYGAVSQVVLVSGTQWVTLENMSIVPGNQAFGNAVRVTDRSHHFTLRGCKVSADQSTATTGISLVNIESPSDNGKACNYTVLENNTITGGRIGIYYSYGSVDNARALYPVISGNTVSEAGRMAIYVNMTTGAHIKGNTITNTMTTATAYAGIDMYYNDGQFVIEGNNIVNTQSAYNYGIYLRAYNTADASAPARVFNNSIVISGSNSSNYGVQYFSTCSNVEFAYNTIRMGGLGRAFYGNNRDGQFVGLSLKNNLIQGLGESGDLMFFYSNRTANVTATDNVLYHAAGNLTNAISDIETFNTTFHGVNKVEQAEFVSETDNHLSAAGDLRCGTAVDYVTTDLDGVERDASAPTVGAYEYRDIVAVKPELLVEAPVALAGEATETTATFVTRWSTGGKLYSAIEAVSTPDGAPAHAAAKAPSAADLKSGTAQTVVADTDVTTTFEELEANTQYKAYFLMVSDAGAESDLVESVEFTTASPAAEPLTIEIDDPVTINAGESATLTGIWAGGIEPYTITWADQQGNVIETVAGEEYQITVTPAITTGYTLTVSSADGQSVTRRTGVKVRGAQAIATFEDNVIPTEGYDQGYSDWEQVYSGSYGFEVGSYYSNYDDSHPENGGYWTWYGYGLSNTTATDYRGFNYLYPDQFNSVPGGAHSGDNFMIACPVPYGDDPCAIEVTADADGEVISGFYITNTAYAYNVMITGNKFSTKASQGDWFKVTAIGHHADGTTTSKDFYLADYRADEAVDRYLIDKWEWFDLTDLGKVTKITFSFDGTDSDPTWGLNTPMYFAMDDFAGTKVEDEVTRTTGGVENIDLASLFTLESDGSTVEYGIEKELTGTLTVKFDATAKQLKVKGTRHGESGVVHLWARQKGHTQYVALTINIDHTTAVTDIDAAGTGVTAVYNLQGVHVGNTLDDVEPGVYIVREGNVTRKVIK